MEPGCELFVGLPAVIASAPMRQVLDQVRRVARTTVSVLICGETGTGKEIVARAIHHYSMRSAKPWVDINCGALPEHLMETELFGHDKGAFSGADAAREGLFELAHQGTILLDEIGELDPRMQVKLLRVLDGVPYYRVGGRRKVAVDVRVLAATNRPLDEAVAQGRFRADLFHRLGQYQIQVPPLRERRDDIVPLAEYFLRQHSPEAGFSPEAAAMLRNQYWPGNVRQLRNAVTHAVINAKGYRIGPEDLPELAAPPDGPAPAGGALNLDQVERAAIRRALERTGGHHENAAGLLGISRRTLSRKLKIYRVESSEEAGRIC